jgi:hypothetical protein BACCOPRO_00235
MEKLMQYVWEYRLWDASQMHTVDGRKIRVIDPGIRNTDAGPDFFNAKIDIDGKIWAGNVEIHYRASDWKRHKHHMDAAYDTVILHVVDKDDAPAYRKNGELIPQMVMSCSPHFKEKLNSLIDDKSPLPCGNHLRDFHDIFITEWVEALAFERLNSKVDRIRSLYNSFNGSLEDVCYVTLARNLGFGLNSDAFERLAKKTPLNLLHKHSDSLVQIEALLFGQAGMLDASRYIHDDYYQHLCKEYKFLADKFNLTPMDGSVWKLLRVRPHNFPHRRIAMLAHYIHGGFGLMKDICEAEDEKSLRKLFYVKLTGYWSAHFSFDKPSPVNSLVLGSSAIDIILINTVAPLYYFYGENTGDYNMTDKSIALLEDLRPEKNSIIFLFEHYGLKVHDALFSQALIQLRRAYCEQKKCLYCRIGHRLLSMAVKR